MKRKSRKRAARWTLGLKKLKAISIRQPWAWLIVNGYKDVENRIWAANVRGRGPGTPGPANQTQTPKRSSMIRAASDVNGLEREQPWTVAAGVCRNC
jgi:hypothetical protein